jgi:hypothetical protein
MTTRDTIACPASPSFVLSGEEEPDDSRRQQDEEKKVLSDGDGQGVHREQT